MQIVSLKPGRQKSVINGHPWVFSGALQRSKDAAESVGNWVKVAAADGTPLAIGYTCPGNIAMRLVSVDVNTEINEHFFYHRFSRLMAERAELMDPGMTNCYRLCFSEADGLPGLIVDVYHHWYVLQILTRGMENKRSEILSALQELRPSWGVFERSDDATRREEGLSVVVEQIKAPTGRPPDATSTPDSSCVEVLENGMRFAVDLNTGHKTGFYLDQRDSRFTVGRYCRERDVLNCFSYTGGFTVSALRNDARRVVSVDTSAPALERLRQHVMMNCSDGLARSEVIIADVFQQLRHFRDEGETFDVIVLDPPKFVHSQKDLKRGSRGYQDINRLAMSILRPGGFLATFSCSGRMSPDLFQKILFSAALEAQAAMRIVHPLYQASDHPIPLTFPEALYLKGFLLQKVGV